jgi:hypothetical protein
MGLKAQVLLNEGPLWVLVVPKRFGRSRIATFHAPKPFTIIGERKLVDC